MRKLSLLLTLLSVMCIVCSCNKKQPVGENPFFAQWDTPFGVPPFDKIKIEHYKPAFEAAMQQESSEIDSIANSTEQPTFQNVILAYSNSGEMLTKVANVFFLVGSADTNPDMQAIEEELSPVLSQHSDKILLNEKLFAKIKTVYDNRETLGLDSLQMRLLDKTYRQFVRAGANLSQQDKETLKKINEELSIIGVKYGNNLLADNNSFTLELDSADLTGLPQSTIDAAKEQAKNMKKEGKYIFTLKKPSMIPFITYSDRRDLREKLYKGYLNRCSYDNETDNKQIINDMTRLRIQKANLLGYPSYSAFVLDNVMAKTPDNVYSLLNALWTPALKRATAELEDMKAIKKSETGSDEFASWDWWYYAEKVRKEKYDLNEEMLRPYFSLENVRAGIFDLSNRLYGITFRPISAPAYNSECMVYEVLDIDNSHLGVLYLDFHPRDGKRPGAWCGEYREQSYDANGKRIAPVVSIVCNFTRPTEDAPALLNLDETETFFHEFGHALHSLFSDVKYKGLTGVERDFVELPSQIMENWATEPQMLKRYATHYQTGEPISDMTIEKIRSSALFNQGFSTVEYLAASLSDMDIHTMTSYKPFDVNAFEQQALTARRGLIPQIAPRYRYPYFSHIFDGGYSSGYYSYIWAEVLDKDAYQAFVESGDIFNRDIATSFRKNVLSKGGTADGMTLYKNFRQAEPSREPLLKARGLIEQTPQI